MADKPARGFRFDRVLTSGLERAQLVQFVTGSSQMPCDGFANLQAEVRGASFWPIFGGRFEGCNRKIQL